MADPVTIGAGFLVAGAVTGAIGSIQNGYNQEQQLKNQQAADEYNARIYEQQAAQASATAVSKSNIQNDRAQQDIGDTTAAIAESGIGFTGTSQDILNQSRINAEMDRENILYQGLLQNNAYQSQANMARYNGQVAQGQEGAAVSSGYIGAGAGLLSSVGNYYTSMSSRRAMGSPRFGAMQGSTGGFDPFATTLNTNFGGYNPYAVTG